MNWKKQDGNEKSQFFWCQKIVYYITLIKICTKSLPFDCIEYFSLIIYRTILCLGFLSALVVVFSTIVYYDSTILLYCGNWGISRTDQSPKLGSNQALPSVPDSRLISYPRPNERSDRGWRCRLWITGSRLSHSRTKNYEDISILSQNVSFLPIFISWGWRSLLTRSVM